jgi:hypothetical protein
VEELPGQARYLLDPGRGENAALRLLDPDSGRLLEIISDAASIRVGPRDPPAQIWLEPLMSAAEGHLLLRCGAA